MSTTLDILIVDDDDAVRMSIGDALSSAGHEITEAIDGVEAAQCIAKHAFDVVICDVRLPRADGMAVLRQVRHDSPETDVIMMTAHARIADAVASLREGAYDYLLKPFDTDDLAIRIIGRIAERRSLRAELERTRDELAERDISAVIIGHSPPMLRLLDRIDTIAQSDAPVLITGESGTGKELVARTLHAKSKRKGAFLAVNCAAFPDSLLEAELFGHERGAFTGAMKRRDGRFRAANGGTLLLDEIAEVPLTAQVKLLRVLEEGSVEPLGSNDSVSVDCRIIAATHRNLKERVAEGRFREDLYYRLNVLDLVIPPLRDRPGDLPLLLAHYLRKFSPKGPPDLSPRAWAALHQHSFPGNVRELAHAIERAVVLSAGREIDIQHLPVDIVGDELLAAMSGDVPFRSLSAAMKQFERQYLQRALDVAGGVRAKAAELLGISRKNLWEKLRNHSLGDDELT